MVFGYYFVTYLIKALHNDNDPSHGVLAGVFFALWSVAMLEVIGNMNGGSLIDIFL
ncbi:hypothetical protein [Aquibacillus koreensis]|nr:hypothetical protein [Aquibacillus koreensis]